MGGSVGSGVSPSVGLSVGSAVVGAGVGPGVGSGVSGTVGAGLGCGVGAGLGSGVDAMGAGVGFGVGWMIGEVVLDDCIGEVVCAVTVVAKRSIIAARWHAFVVISTVGVSNGRRLVRFIVFYVSRELFSNEWQNELWAFFRQRLDAAPH